MARIHTKKDIVNAFLIAVSSILIFLSIDHYMGEFVRKYFYIFGIIALLLYVFKYKIIQRFKDNVLSNLVTDIIAHVMLFLSLKVALEYHINNPIIYLIFGISIYAFYPIISSAIVQEN